LGCHGRVSRASAQLPRQASRGFRRRARSLALWRKHADWDELTSTIAGLRPEELWITHGNEEALLRWSELSGIEARALEIAGYGDEEE
jgi:putative mRNA 3-end processing factor